MNSLWKPSYKYSQQMYAFMYFQNFRLTYKLNEWKIEHLINVENDECTLINTFYSLFLSITLTFNICILPEIM